MIHLTPSERAQIRQITELMLTQVTRPNYIFLSPSETDRRVRGVKQLVDKGVLIEAEREIIKLGQLGLLVYPQVAYQKARIHALKEEYDSARVYFLISCFDERHLALGLADPALKETIKQLADRNGG